jgi:hypothetical protein
MSRKRLHVACLQSLDVNTDGITLVVQLLEGAVAVEVPLHHFVSLLAFEDTAVDGEPARHLEQREVVGTLLVLEVDHLVSGEAVEDEASFDIGHLGEASEVRHDDERGGSCCVEGGGSW